MEETERKDRKAQFRVGKSQGRGGATWLEQNLVNFLALLFNAVVVPEVAKGPPVVDGSGLGDETALWFRRMEF